MNKDYIYFTFKYGIYHLVHLDATVLQLTFAFVCIAGIMDTFDYVGHLYIIKNIDSSIC